ncbi:MAG: nuclease A inhibitor family protein [Acidobacteria bacterium]|nr:nuclease A inhibitor family protein [Acidobacteriota bacterium]
MTKKTKKNLRSAIKKKVFSIEELTELTQGVIYISETDAELEPFQTEDSEPEIRPLSKATSKDIEEISFDNFFNRLSAKKEWHTAADRKRTAAYSKIREYLEDHLTDLHVVRTGRVQIEILVFGKAEDGTVAGFRTRAVET